VKRLVNFSGGACSYFAAEREIAEYGAENVVLLFADVLIEHPDLYDFNRRAEDKLGVKITRLCVGLTPWQLFRKEGLIANARFPICSIRLKREPLNDWMESHYNLNHDQGDFIMEPGTVVLGFDWTELHRVSEFQLEHPTWALSAPMCDAPLWDKCRMLAECEKRGFKKQTLYELGFPHNNCGGTCVRAGISHFVHLLKVLPATFTEWEREELETQEDFKQRGISNWNFTILKDRRGGETKPLTLRELRLRVQSGEKFPEYDWGGCGCGG
jgi:hypothetical protein